MTQKSLDRKLAAIRADSSSNEFILADAKDADMAYGMAAPGQSPEYHGQEGRFRTLAEYRELIRANVEQGLVDIVLMSASTCDRLAVQERLFENSHVTPAARANDTSDIHVAAGSVYRSHPSRPFRTATIDHIMCGRQDCPPGEPHVGADLGLYSMTFNNDLELDFAALNAYRDFRIEAERKGFRHFLEVFDPNAPQAPIADLPRFLNDVIARCLAGVADAGRPVFLKIPYHGPEAMEQLATYDPGMVPGILGGSSGTTMDAFHQLTDAKKHGAKVALYGRMINNSEHQPSFIEHLRAIADGELTDPAQAVRSYHGAIENEGIAPYRPLEEDLVLTARETAYGGSGAKKKTAAVVDGARPDAAGGQDPDFASMSAAEKVAWNRKRWNRVLGG